MSAIFPAAVATQLQLLTAQNNSLVELTVACGVGDTILTVDDTSALPTVGYLTFDDGSNEVIHYTGVTATTLTGCTRGADSTTAAIHAAGVNLEQRWNADYHNILTLEIASIEDNIRDRLGLNTNIVVPTGVTVTVTNTDITLSGAGKGIVVKDAVDGNSYRIAISGGELTTEQVI